MIRRDAGIRSTAIRIFCALLANCDAALLAVSGPASFVEIQDGRTLPQNPRSLALYLQNTCSRRNPHCTGQHSAEA